MAFLYSKSEIEEVAQSLVNENSRTEVFSMFADSITEADLQLPGNWAVHCQKNAIRLTAGHYYVFTIDSRGVWLALDKNLIESTNSLTDLQGLGWNWDDVSETYRWYKDKYHNPFSMNGYYHPLSMDYLTGWPTLSRYHFEFLNSIHNIGQTMRSNTPRTHAEELLKYLRDFLNRDVPAPSYS